jgi:hypothetical protein
LRVRASPKPEERSDVAILRENDLTALRDRKGAEYAGFQIVESKGILRRVYAAFMRT